VKELLGVYHLVARGAGYDAAFGVGIDGVPADATGTVRIERFGSDGSHTVEAATSLAERRKLLRDGRTSLRLDDLFPSTRAALSAPGEPYANTSSETPDVSPASVQVRIVFDVAVDPLGLALPPYDPFLLVGHAGVPFDIHLPGKQAFLDRSADLPSEDTPDNFVDDAGRPWVLSVPFDWRFPLEAVPITTPGATTGAYPKFDDWRASRGQASLDWYKTPNLATPGRVTAALANSSRDRPWTLVVGGAP
jgi:LruC domain-containing protein